jgi:hypothetical protein
MKNLGNDMSPRPMHPDLSKFILDGAQSKEHGWKWPRYHDSISAGPLSHRWLDTGKPNSLISKSIQAGLNSTFCSKLSAAYIEWKYYSVLSDAFHGIIGLSLYNPEEKFSKVAEGGMLCVIAGAAPTQIRNNDPNDNETARFVWMKLFPIGALQGLRDSVLTAQHGQASLTLEDSVETNCGYVKFSEGDDIQVEARFQGPQSAPPPLIGTGLNPIPGGHWIVNNRMPFGVTEGSLFIGKAATKTSSARTTWSNAPAYFEHSFGLNPLPWQGWDFFFAPLDAMRGGAVLQSYRNCPSLKQLDVTWTDPTDRKTKSTSFCGGDFSIEWEHKEYDHDLSAWIPTQRILRGRNAQFEVTLTNTIGLTLPFLRKQTTAVRCFFIGEQIGSASWVIKDLKGNVIDEQRDVRAGGEIAYARFPSLGRLYQPFPV